MQGSSSNSHRRRFQRESTFLQVLPLPQMQSHDYGQGPPPPPDPIDNDLDDSVDDGPLHITYTTAAQRLSRTAPANPHGDPPSSPSSTSSSSSDRVKKKKKKSKVKKEKSYRKAGKQPPERLTSQQEPVG